MQEITQNILKDMDRRSSFHWQATAMLAIHSASKDYMVKIFEAAQLNAIHGKRVTILPKDMQLSKGQRRIFDNNNN